MYARMRELGLQE